MSATALIVVATGTALGAAVQGVYGFGFALVAAPLLAAVLRPEEAVALLGVASLAVSGTVLLTGAPSAAGDHAARSVLPWALAGLPLGCVLWLVPDDPVRMVVCLGALLAALAMLRTPNVAAVGPPPTRSDVRRLGGLLAGALTVSTGFNGPPLVLVFTRAGLDAAAMRHALAVCFLVLAVPALALLLLAGDAVPPGDALLAGSAGAALGVAAALAVRGRVPPHRFQRDVLLLVAAASLAGLVVVVA